MTLVPLGPPAQRILERLASDAWQRGLRDIAEVGIGLLAATWMFSVEIDRELCSGAFYPDSHGCAHMQGFINDVAVVVGFAMVVVLMLLASGHLYEHPPEKPDPEVSD